MSGGISSLQPSGKTTLVPCTLRVSSLFGGSVDGPQGNLQLTPKERLVFGVYDPGPKTAEAKDIQRAVEDTMSRLNARQVCAKLRAGNGNLVDPPDMQAVDGVPTDQINIYTDGSILEGNRAGAGMAVWVPKTNMSGEYHIHKDKWHLKESTIFQCEIYAIKKAAEPDPPSA